MNGRYDPPHLSPLHDPEEYSLQDKKRDGREHCQMVRARMIKDCASGPGAEPLPGAEGNVGKAHHRNWMAIRAIKD
jgi:hypothetical protein